MTKYFKFDLQTFATPVQPTANNTINYTATDRDNEENFGKLLEPGLRKIFFETYDEIPEQYSKIYNVHTSTKAVEHDWGMGAFGDWEKRVSQLDTVAYKTLSPGLERTYIHEAFTQGFMVTRKCMMMIYTVKSKKCLKLWLEVVVLKLKRCYVAFN